jgi:hypothetical protein
MLWVKEVILNLLNLLKKCLYHLKKCFTLLKLITVNNIVLSHFYSWKKCCNSLKKMKFYRLEDSSNGRGDVLDQTEDGLSGIGQSANDSLSQVASCKIK